MRVTAEILRDWAARLCGARPGSQLTEADLAAALGLPLDPPPPGVVGTRLRGGDIPIVELELRPPLLLGDLDRLLGAGNRLPRVDWDRPHVVAYDVAVRGAAWRCVILARCDQPPEASAPVARVTLRLDPGS